MFTVSSRFVGDFKLGDNIEHNIRTLSYMYSRMHDIDDSDSGLLFKPYTILIGSICEATLYDLHARMRTNTNEGVFGIPNKVLNYVRSKKIDKFETYITSARKHKLLGNPEDSIYEQLDELRKLRNRVHIQNEKNHFEADDNQAFNLERKLKAEQAMEKLLKILSNNNPRSESAQGYVNDFMLPWDEYYPDI